MLFSRQFRECQAVQDSSSFPRPQCGGGGGRGISCGGATGLISAAASWRAFASIFSTIMRRAMKRLIPWLRSRRQRTRMPVAGWNRFTPMSPAFPPLLTVLKNVSTKSVSLMPRADIRRCKSDCLAGVTGKTGDFMRLYYLTSYACSCFKDGTAWSPKIGFSD